MAKKDQAEVVEIPKEEYEEMKRTNQENSALINQLVEKLDVVQNAQLAGTGIDPKIAARNLIPRRRVQFLDKYARSAEPSKIQKRAMVHRAYSVSGGDVVLMKEDEIKRITAEYPDLIETDESKFVKKINHRAIQELDDHGRMRWKKIENPITVKTLIENAIEVG